MLTNQQLVDKARTAIENYKHIYGKYPAMVGIDRQRLRSMTTTQICFPEVNGPLPKFYWEEGDGNPLDVQAPSVRFHPYQGGLPDEVYLPRPNDNRKEIRGAVLARLCNLVKIRRERTLYEPLKVPPEVLASQARELARELYGIHQKVGLKMPSYMEKYL